MMRPPIAVASSPGGGDTSGLAASLAVASCRRDGGACLLVEFSSGAPADRAPTLLASSEAREIERSLKDAGLKGASRGHICTIALDESLWEEIGPDSLIEIAGGYRVVFSMGAGVSHERMPLLSRGLAGCVVLLNLPEERSLGALIAAEMLGSGTPVKLTGSSPGPVAARRALAGVLPGGASERYARMVVECFAARSGAEAARR